MAVKAYGLLRFAPALRVTATTPNCCSWGSSKNCPAGSVEPGLRPRTGGIPPTRLNGARAFALFAASESPPTPGRAGRSPPSSVRSLTDHGAGSGYKPAATTDAGTPERFPCQGFPTARSFPCSSLTFPSGYLDFNYGKRKAHAYRMRL